MAKKHQRHSRRTSGPIHRQGEQTQPVDAGVSALRNGDADANQHRTEEAPATMSKLEKASHWSVIVGTVIGVIGLLGVVVGLQQTAALFKQDQRARLSIKDFTFLGEALSLDASPPTVDIRITVRNHGDTPALSLRNKFALTMSEQGLPAEPDWAAVERRTDDTLFPDSEFFIHTGRREVPRDRVEKFFRPVGSTDPRMRLYIRFRVEYCDVFGFAHWVQSCATSPPNSRDGSFDLCGSTESGEYEDQDCPE